MGKTIVITAGGTSEYIDSVRKITNSGTGRLGVIIAQKFVVQQNIDKIFYICSKNSLKPESNQKIEVIEIDGTLDLEKKVKNVLLNNKIDFFIHSMAVSDYYVDMVTTSSLIDNFYKSSFKETLSVNDVKLDNTSKLSSYEDDLIVVMKKTPKIIKEIKELSPNTHLIGFKLLSNVSKRELIDVARNLLIKNDCDFVVANDVKDITRDKHEAIILDKINEKYVHTKDEIALSLLEVVKKEED